MITEIDETFHIAVTYSGAVKDCADGNGYRFLDDAQAKMREIKKHTPDTRLTVFRVTVEVVQA